MVQIVKTTKVKTDNDSTCVDDASTRSFVPNSTTGTPKPTTEATSLSVLIPIDDTLPPNDPNGVGYYWYPMYVRYRQELKVQKELDERDFKTFVPMVAKASARRRGVKVEVIPAVHNLIFIYSNKRRISWMKMYNSVCTRLQYMSFRNNSDGISTVITVPDKQMENIIRAATVEDPDGARSYIDTPKLSAEVLNKRIRFIRGPFEGIEGIIKRVQKNRVMLIELPNDKCIKINISSAQDIEYL